VTFAPLLTDKMASKHDIIYNMLEPKPMSCGVSLGDNLCNDSRTLAPNASFRALNWAAAVNKY